MTLRTAPLLILVTLLTLAPCRARVFTDDGGRQVEAELVGVHGDHAVLSRDGNLGRWPIAKLSPKDRLYVRTWAANPPTTPKLTVRLFERDGIGPAGVFQKDGPPGPPKNIPLLRQTEETPKYKHYEADITNPSQVDANHLTMAYILYVIEPDGGVYPQSSRTPVGPLAAGARLTVPTQAITYVRTKTTSLTLGVNFLGNITTGTDTDRSKERFGGAWIRVYASDGALVAEARKLHPEVERLNPAWTGESTPPEPPLLKALDALGKLLEKLPKPPGDLPTPPAAFPPKPQVPPKKPPGF